MTGAESSHDQLFYDQEPLGTREQHAAWMSEIRFYFDGYADRLNRALPEAGGNVVELGAGSCGLSVCVSGLARVRRIYAGDISMVRMNRMLELTAGVLNGEISKIEPVACDFNVPLPFETGSMDAVLFDAALHHSRSIWTTLSECRRVLRKGGVLVAQRESYLSPLRASGQLSALLATPEVAANVSENMYLRAQYEYYLSVNGFATTFIPRTPSRAKKLLSSFNGTLFCDGVLYCIRQ